MEIRYSAVASELMELSLLPNCLASKSEAEWDFSNKEREILQDVLPVMEELREILLPFSHRMEAYHLSGYGLTLLQSCYLSFASAGHVIESMEDVHEACLQMTKEEIRKELTDLVNTEVEHMDQDTDFWTRLELSSAKPETKWHFSQFYRKPLESMEKLVELSRELVPLYQPFLEKGRKEREAFAASFSLEAFLEESNYLSQFDLSSLKDQVAEVYYLSPWMVRFASHSLESQRSCFIISCRVDQLLLSHQELDSDTFTTLLKVMSDETRYKVLMELTKPHAKSKNIAQALDITGAAVSFHAQKLINAQLLLFNREDKDIKYNVNKALLKEAIAKLQRDFQLEDEE